MSEILNYDYYIIDQINDQLNKYSASKKQFAIKKDFLIKYLIENLQYDNSNATCIKHITHTTLSRHEILNLPVDVKNDLCVWDDNYDDNYVVFIIKKCIFTFDDNSHCECYVALLHQMSYTIDILYHVLLNDSLIEDKSTKKYRLVRDYILENEKSDLYKHKFFEKSGIIFPNQ
jgi:hypothetical protein